MLEYFEIRNIAIIAHVDHGKTTLVNNLMKQGGVFEEHQKVGETVMDCNALEQERNITILAKTTTVYYKNPENDSTLKINVIDTPGHADFGGEVERVLSMVDGVVLLVDSSEGPMPQTKFVLSKALKLGLKPIVIINKIDRQDAREKEVLNEIYELFFALDANEEQIDFPVLYASGRSGWADTSMDGPRKDLAPLFELVRTYVSSPKIEQDSSFKMLATILNADPYVGRILIGKIYSGSVQVGQNVKAMKLDGSIAEQAKVTKLFGFKGIERVPIERALAGDIIAIAGLTNASVADTICDLSAVDPIASTPIDPPTMSVTLSVNDSPLAGKEGTKLTSRVILDRLQKEAEHNVAITLKISDSGDSFEVGGRGELQLGVLIETMRREGFEMSVSKPKVLMKTAENGDVLEPIEEVTIDVDDEFSGIVVEKLSARRGDMIDMRPSGYGKTRIIYHIPSRSLIGYQSEFRNDTRGTGVLSKMFYAYAKSRGQIPGRPVGVLISNSGGSATGYSLFNLQDRGVMFVSHGTEVYEGMIIGEHNRNNDLEVNPVKAKQLTNIRAAGSDENIKLTPPRLMTLEDAISYIADDELVECTPKSIRLRKRYLSANDRKKFSKNG